MLTQTIGMVITTLNDLGAPPASSNFIVGGDGTGTVTFDIASGNFYQVTFACDTANIPNGVIFESVTVQIDAVVTLSGAGGSATWSIDFDNDDAGLDPVSGTYTGLSTIAPFNPLSDTVFIEYTATVFAGGGDTLSIQVTGARMFVTYALPSIYPDFGAQYDQGTDDPILRAYDGFTDSIACRVPKVGATAAKAIVSVLTANEKVYFSTFDSGTTTGTDVAGSVYEFNPKTGAVIKLGSTFPTGHLPYSLLWAYGRLWCGTAVNVLNGATAGRVYFFRPGIDTDWTLDHTFGANESIVSGLALFQGQMYASVLFSSTGSGTAKVLQRTTLGVWSNSDTGTIDTDATGVARGYYSLLTWPRENGKLQSPTPALFAVRKGIHSESGYVIRKFNGSSWSSVYTGGAGGPDLVDSYLIELSGNTVVPVIASQQGQTSLVNSTDGATFTERVAQVTITAGGAAGLVIQRK